VQYQPTHARRRRDAPRSARARESDDIPARQVNDSPAQLGGIVTVQQSDDVLAQQSASNDAQIQQSNDSPAQASSAVPAQRSNDPPNQQINDTPAPRSDETPAQQGNDIPTQQSNPATISQSNNASARQSGDVKSKRKESKSCSSSGKEGEEGAKTVVAPPLPASKPPPPPSSEHQAKEGAEKKSMEVKLENPHKESTTIIQENLRKPSKMPSHVRIRNSMKTVMKTVEVSDKSIESDLAKEDVYWETQEQAFGRLMKRIEQGRTTMRDFSSLLRKQQKAAYHAGKYLQIGGAWKDFGEGEGTSLRAVCLAQDHLQQGLIQYFDSIQEQLYQKPAEEALKYAKELSSFAAKVSKDISKLRSSIKKQRDLASRCWNAYKLACMKRHKSYEQEKAMRPSDDPFLAFETYKRQVISLHKQQASYNAIMGQVMAEFESRECTRARNLRALMLEVVSTQKGLFENAALMCAQAVAKLSSVNLEDDLLRFRHSGGLLHNPHTQSISFEPKSFGMDFKDNLITGIRSGSQAEKKGVKVGWRILKINEKNAPATHKDIASLLETLKKAGSTIKVSFGKKTSGIIFEHPPPRRNTQHIQILSNAECATVGELSRMSKTMGFTSWTKMYCVITFSGNMHILNSSEAVSPHSSIQLHQSIIRLAPKVDQHAFEIEEATSGFFGSGIKIHTFRTKTEPALVDWMCEIKKFLKSEKADIKVTK